MKMMNLASLCLVLTSLVTGAIWSPPQQQVIVKDAHRVAVLEFQEQTKVLISQDKDSAIGDGGGLTGPKEFFSKCRDKLGTALNVVSSKAHSGKVKTIGAKASGIVDVIDQAIDMIGLKAGIEGALKDNVAKVADWDAVDSPKRIGEDIERNVSRKVEQGAEEVKETVKDTSLSELLSRSRKVVSDMLAMVSLEKIRRVISWCHLLGFSTAYGMGVWVTFISSCVLGKCLPSQQVVNKVHMVYLRALACCVGASLVGYVASQGWKGVMSNKMKMFQGFNLLSSLFMILVNLIFLEPRVTMLIAEGRKAEEKRESKQKLKKLNAYSSTLNVSTMVVLTWHLAYMGQLLQARH